ncbi:aminoglycoside phosphotransferase family protein [Catellatospora paridis]|uniref:aminoglycoside phosphotransferase family protein n=1 Tax=Catellatospora paridis TaxID=1617086 RepID=UPI0012D3E77F|nr:aminoglycoside phosphotransferase family protein [Catellatospora paridis]
MAVASGVRIGWADVPEHVQAEVETILGDRIVEAVTQQGGFSPGTADRVRTAGGRRAFVKAVSTAQNERSVQLHRQEALVTAALPPNVPAPRLLGCFDDGGWIALVLQDVEGRHPVTPWTAPELDAVLDTLGMLATGLTPCPIPDLPTVAALLGNDLRGWERLATDPPDDLDPWAVARLPELIELGAAGVAALDGETVAHTDIRADNLLVGPDGTVTVVDWPWACVGPAWLDSMMIMVNVNLFGGHDVDALLAAHTAPLGARPADVTGVLAGMTGYFLDAARRPAPPGIPTVRAFQRAQGEASLRWLRTRLEAGH